VRERGLRPDIFEVSASYRTGTVLYRDYSERLVPHIETGEGRWISPTTGSRRTAFTLLLAALVVGLTAPMASDLRGFRRPGTPCRAPSPRHDRLTPPSHDERGHVGRAAWSAAKLPFRVCLMPRAVSATTPCRGSPSGSPRPDVSRNSADVSVRATSRRRKWSQQVLARDLLRCFASQPLSFPRQRRPRPTPRKVAQGLPVFTLDADFEHYVETGDI